MRWFANLRLSAKFSIIILTLLFFLLGLGGAGIWGTTSLNGILREVQGEQIPDILNLTSTLNKIQATRSELHLALLDFEPSRVEAHLTASRQDITEATTRLNAYQAATHIAEEASLGKNLNDHWQSWLEQANEVLELAQSNSSVSFAQGLQLLTNGRDQAIVQDLGKLINFNENVELQNKINQAGQTFAIVMIVMVVVLLSVLILNGLTLVILRRFISNPLVNLRRATQAVAAGNLMQQVSIETTDEVGDLARAFNQMTAQLSQRIEENSQTSLAVQDLAANLATTTDHQEIGTREHAAGVSQVRAAMIELRETATQIAQNITNVSCTVDNALSSARNVREVTEQVAAVSDSGRQTVETSICGIELVRQKIEDLAGKLTLLTDRSQQILTIADLMSDIARKIHLLALNAAIESASAGKYGLRFSAVALEVKQLANHSLSAASKVRETLGEVQEAITTAAMVAEEGKKETLSAVALAYQSGEVIDQLGRVVLTARSETDSIVTTIETTRAVATEIVLATQQQQSANDQVVMTISGIEDLAREVASGNANINRIVGVLQALSAQLGERSKITTLAFKTSAQVLAVKNTSHQAA